MSTFREQLLTFIDDQITVKDGLWLSDLKFLTAIPVLPGLVATFFAFNEWTRGLVGIGLVLCVPWTVFLYKRRELKKQSWVEPTRFSDLNGGY